MKCLPVLGILACLLTVDGACTNCNFCANDQCTSNTDCRCKTACKDGYYGARCLNSCPEQCVSCGREYGVYGHATYGICYTCSAGYHHGSSTNCLCPLSCQKCSSTTQCTVCNTGLYGSVCDTQCPTYCKNNVCGISDGTCSQGCVDGWYGNKCWTECSSKCMNRICAQNNGDCSSCNDGWYGSQCNAQCPTNCKDNICAQSTGDCSRGCESGKQGPQCYTDCPANCKGDICDQYTGRCTQGCENGWYGNTCTSQCSTNCKDNICNQNDGFCIECEAGKQGANCNTNCPAYCKDGICDQYTGTCTQGCMAGRYGWKCNSNCPANCKDNICEQYGGKCVECVPGKHGAECYQKCPSNCKSNICEQYGGKCVACVPGKHGAECNQNCPANCKGTICDQTTVSCTLGCLDGFHGNQCWNNCPTYCKDNVCDQLTVVCTNGCEHDNFAGDQCNQCKPGFYNEQCNTSCPINCQDRTCNRYSGDCTNACVGNFKGNKCDACKSGFSGDQCCVEKGHCDTCKSLSECSKCVTGYFGSICDSRCSTNCTDGCSKGNGHCNKCVVGKYGVLCDELCSTKCVNSTCAQDSGSCMYGCINGFQGQYCSMVLASVGDGPGVNVAGPVAGAVSGVIVIAVIAVVGFIFLQRRKGRSQQASSPSKELSQVSKSYSTPSRHTPGEQAKENSASYYENETNGEELIGDGDDDDDDTGGADGGIVDPEYINFAESKTNINLSDLYNYVSQAAEKFFKNEFQQLPRSFPHACTFSRNPDNRTLNRFKGIYPYDHSRVKLKDDPNFFINACYIDGYKAQKAYIASVGPTKDITHKFVSFWRMLWHEQSDVIVMLTNLLEPSGMKCEQYWPLTDDRTVYGDITVENTGISVYAEYTLTQLAVTKGKQRRSVTHIQYTAWPDKSVPDNVVSLVEFRQKVKSIKTLANGPTIVHCSAGVGRTGTYIALDILTDQGKSDNSINVFDCVLKLREQRVNMVQTHEQYEYLHRCMVYTLVFGSGPLTVEKVQTHVAKLNDSTYTRKFQLLEQSMEGEVEDEKEARDLNRQQKDKNRQGADIPGNRGRPRLFLNRAFNEPDYINAVYIDSFKKTNRYIGAQTPLSSSLSDFICLIYQNGCSCIVDMNDTSQNTKQNVGIYLPALNESLKVDSYNIRCSSREVKPTYIKSILAVTNTSQQRPGEVSIEHYQYTGWRHEDETPSDVGQFVQFVNTVQIAAENQPDELSPLLVHCMNAFERSGLFCTLAVLLEKLECEQQVNIGNTIRQIRIRRSKAIPNKAQLKFLYQCAAAYTDMFSTYSNFAM